MRRRGLRSLIWVALRDLFDQSTGFGRLAAVHVGMMAGDTLVTVSLAGSLFFSVSPTEAKSKVLAYLLLTFAPFAVVSPLLGPLIDRSSQGRRILVAVSAAVRILLCWMMSRHLHSWLLFPEAFALLVASKLYVVTRGTLVPEMARSNQFGVSGVDLDAAGWPVRRASKDTGFAGFNAQLTLLGTGSALVMGAFGAAILKIFEAPGVLIAASFVFTYTSLVALRLHPPVRGSTAAAVSWHALSAEIDHVEVSWGLVAMSLLRFATGFLGFLLVFGLRHLNAGLGWYAAALSATGVGSLVGLSIVTKIHGQRADATLLAWSHLVLALATGFAATRPSLGAQVMVAGVLGVVGAIAQPSFDSITQQHVPLKAQGRTFARFAVRQQLAWVLGSLIPVGVSMSFSAGDRLIAVTCLVVGLVYGLGRRFAK